MVLASAVPKRGNLLAAFKAIRMQPGAIVLLYVPAPFCTHVAKANARRINQPDSVLEVVGGNHALHSSL